MSGSAHFSLEEIAAYDAGELAEAEEARVQDHLLSCAECTRLLLDLAALRRGAEPDEEAPQSEKDAFWQGLQPRLAETAETAETGEAPAPAAVRGPLPFPARQEAPRLAARRLRAFQLLAATLAFAVLGLALQNASLRRTVGGLSQPDLGAPVSDLSVSGPREAGAPAVVSLLPENRFFTLVLSPAGREFPVYEVVLERDGGGEVWRRSGLKRNRYGTFSLILARPAAGAGDYTLRLSGTAGGRKEPAGEYHFRIETP